jgi:hypothetical protein
MGLGPGMATEPVAYGSPTVDILCSPDIDLWRWLLRKGWMVE